MGTIYFLIATGVIAFFVVWATRRSSKSHDLEKKSYSAEGKQAFEKLTPTSHDVLSRKEEIWEARRSQVKRDFSAPRRFVPKSVAAAEPQYDGFSRRDRHHLTPKGQIAKEVPGEDIEKHVTP
jgi:hypothetical protein